jgi:hypothetical protein
MIARHLEGVMLFPSTGLLPLGRAGTANASTLRPHRQRCARNSAGFRGFFFELKGEQTNLDNLPAPWLDLASTRRLARATITSFFGRDPPFCAAANIVSFQGQNGLSASTRSMRAHERDGLPERTSEPL